MYSYISGENSGAKLSPFIIRFFRSEFFVFSSKDVLASANVVSVVFEAVSFTLLCASSLVTFIVYVLVVFPSSAVTTTFIAFLPTFKFCVPFPFIVAFLSCAVAYTVTLSVSFGTVTS